MLVSNDEIKKIAYEGLCRFDGLCKKHSLTYYLFYGTLLGAVRHNGFIPWDDDIDIMMPRQDYEKLISLSEIIEDDEWELLSYKFTEGYAYPWAKYCNKETAILPSRFHSGLVYGIAIDIFPLQTVKGESEQDVYNSIKFLKNEYSDLMRTIRPLRMFKPGMKNKMIELFRVVYYYAFGKKKKLKPLLEKIDEDLASVSDTEAKYCMCSCDILDVSYAGTNRRIFEISDFTGGYIMPKELLFENSQFCVPVNYDKVLNTIYGNYMELPPENKRVSHHTYKCIYKKNRING